MTLDQFIELLKAFGQYAWPILAIIAFLKLLPSIRAFLSREKVKIKIGGMEVSAEQVTQSLTGLVSDLQEKVAQIEQKINAAIETAEDVPVHLPMRRGEKLRILWVDDVPANIAIQVQKLMSDGFWIDIASTTAQAIAMFELTKYDLVISDMGRTEEKVHKPNAGIILGQEIRQRDGVVPIIIFTTHQNIARFQESARNVGITAVTNSTVDLYRIIDGLFAGDRSAN